MCALLTAGESAYIIGPGSSSSVLTDLSHQYITTQHGTARYQDGTGVYKLAASSTQYGAAGGMYSTPHGSGGIDGYFASESQQTAGNNLQPGTAFHPIEVFDLLTLLT